MLAGLKEKLKPINLDALKMGEQKQQDNKKSSETGKGKMNDETYSGEFQEPESETEADLAERILQEHQQARESAESKGSGRKSKAEEEAEAVTVNADLMSLPFNVINAYISSASSGDVSLSKKEIKDLSVLSSKVLNKHLTVDMLKFQEEIALLIYMSSITAEKTTEYKKKHPSWKFPIPFKKQFVGSWKWLKSLFSESKDNDNEK